MNSNIPSVVIDFAELNFASLFPMIIVILGALSILCIDLFTKKSDKSLYVILCVLFLLMALGAVIGFSGPVRGMFDLMLIDGISVLAQIIILISSSFFVLLYLNKMHFHETQYPEYFALYLFAVAGFMFMVSSDSLILIFVGLETSSMALYTMIAMHNRHNAIEAAIKYFTMGALATAFFAFASMLFYALTGSVELSIISEVLVESGFENYAFVIVGVIFMIGALGFKLSLVPFHAWVADVYQGSSAALAGFISIVPKVAGFVVALRFFEIFVAARDPYVEAILYVIVVLTMTIPNILALLQKDLARMLAYSSISSAGFVMSAVLIGTTQATQAMFLYWILFLVVNLGVFTLLWAMRNKDYENYESDYSYARYAGLVRSSKYTAILMALFMLSLAGIPPLAIFWGKMYLIGSAINSGMIYLAVIMVLNSAIAVYYYLRPIVVMFLLEPKGEIPKALSNSSKALRFVLGTCAIFTLISIFLIEPLLNIILFYVQSSGF